MQRLLDVALARAQREATTAAAAAGQVNAGKSGAAAAGVEAAGMAGLLASARSSLGFSPSAAWSEAARPLLLPVAARIADPAARQRLMVAINGN